MKAEDTSAEQRAASNGHDRNCLEIIRFASTAHQRQAIRALLDHGLLNFSSTREDTWTVYTPIAAKLRELGVPFEWLTEHV